jgi:hypothetical protein
MEEIRFYDSTRRPAYWTALVRKDQFTVCHFDYKTGTWRTAQGTYAVSPDQETIFIFETLDEARTYCREFVAIHPSLFCRIYDYRGNMDGLLETVYPARIAEKLLAAGSGHGHLWRGMLQLAASALCVYADWRITGVVILGAVVGAKFLFSGLNSIVQGIAAVAETRKQKSGGLTV